MNWGKWIIVAFVFFATFIGVLVTVCMRQDVNLVSKEYYKEELAYQEQVARKVNTAALESQPVIEVTADRKLKITFDRFRDVESGNVLLFSPSSSKRDKAFKIESQDSEMILLDMAQVQPGHYVAKMSWSMGGKEYFLEETIFI